MSFLHDTSFQISTNAIANLGDNIQSIALDSIYEQLGITEDSISYIKRDYAHEYCGEPVSVVLFSELTKERVARRLNVAKSVYIKGLISIVFNDDLEACLKAFPSFYDVLKSLEPIGARDETSKNNLTKHGFESYLSGCFTLCFPKRERTPSKEKVFFVDTPKELEPFIPERLRECCEYLSHATHILKYPVDIEENSRLNSLARTLLNRYKEEATLVVTGRLHAAIPCIAMGIPVILAVRNLDFRFGWVEKYIRPFQYGEYNMIDWKPSIVDIEEPKSIMLAYFKKALLSNDTRQELKWLDEYYSNREKVETHKFFREVLNGLHGIHGEDNNFNYMIWGAGDHCSYAYQLISELFPLAQLMIVVDKFKTGEFQSVPVVKEALVDPISIDHMFITTVPGMSDALEWREKFAPNMPYTVICSQMKS